MFFHSAILVVKDENVEKLIALVQEMNNAALEGFNHAHLVKRENAENQYIYLTVWNTREAWESCKSSQAHQEFHKKLEPILEQPHEHGYGEDILLKTANTL